MALSLADCARLADAKQALLAGWKEGAMVIDYVGHGAPQQWANSSFFQVKDLPSLQGQAWLPMVFTFTCLNGFYGASTYYSLCEELNA